MLHLRGSWLDRLGQLLATRDRWAHENGIDVRKLPKGKTWGASLQRKGCCAEQRTIARQTVRGWRGVSLVGADVSQTLGFEGETADAIPQSHNRARFPESDSAAALT